MIGGTLAHGEANVPTSRRGEKLKLGAMRYMYIGFTAGALFAWYRQYGDGACRSEVYFARLSRVAATIFVAVITKSMIG